MTEAASIWGLGTYERIAHRFRPVYEELVARLVPRAGLRWLDLATGTGEVALRAARAGAEVTALDLAPVLLEKAKRAAGAEGLGISFDLGTVERLPYGPASYDVVSSSFGLVFAPDHAAVASEIARVTARGGLLGLTAWRPNPALGDLYAPFGGHPAQLQAASEWGTEAHVEELLAEAFELELEELPFFVEAGSGEEMWDLFSTSAPPVKALADSLSPPRREEFHRAFVDFYEGYRDGDRIKAPRPYLLVLGRRR